MAELLTITLGGALARQAPTFIWCPVTDTDTEAAEFVLTVAPSPQVNILTSPNLPDAYRNMAYSMIFAAEGGSGSGYTWSVVDGTLPPGLSLTPTGTLAGKPSAAGEFSFRVEVTDDSEPPHVAQIYYCRRSDTCSMAPRKTI